MFKRCGQLFNGVGMLFCYPMFFVATPLFADPYAETKAMVERTLRRIARSLPADAPNPREFNVFLDRNWEVPQVHIEFNSSNPTEIPTVHINLSAIWALGHPEYLTGVLAHESVHPIVRLRNKGSSPTTRREEAETDHVGYEVLRAMKEDPTSMARALEQLHRWMTPEQLILDPMHFPMGVPPFAIDPNFENSITEILSALSRTHPHDVIRTTSADFRRVADDLGERIPASFPPVSNYPPMVLRELNEPKSRGFSRSKDADLFMARKGGTSTRLSALYDYLLDMIFEKNGMYHRHRRTIAYSELAQILRLLTDGDKRPATDLQRLGEVRVALRLFDQLLFRGSEYPILDEANVETLHLLILEALRTARVFGPQLPLALSVPIDDQLSDWLDNTIESKSRGELVKGKEHFFSDSSNFLSLLVLANRQAIEELGANDVRALLEISDTVVPSDGKDPLETQGLFYFIYHMREGVLTAFDESAFFSRALRPSLEQINAITNSLDSLPPKFWQNTGYTRSLNINVGNFSNFERKLEPQEYDSFHLIELPDLSVTPDLSSYRRLSGRGGVADFEGVDRVWTWPSLARLSRQEEMLTGETFEENFIELMLRSDHLPEEHRRRLFHPQTDPYLHALETLGIPLGRYANTKSEAAKDAILERYLGSRQSKDEGEQEEYFYAHVVYLMESSRNSSKGDEWHAYSQKKPAMILTKLREMLVQSLFIGADSPLSTLATIGELIAKKPYFHSAREVDQGILRDGLDMLLHAEEPPKQDASELLKDKSIAKALSLVSIASEDHADILGDGGLHVSLAGEWFLGAQIWQKMIQKVIPEVDLLDQGSYINLTLNQIQQKIVRDVAASQPSLKARERALVAIYIFNARSNIASAELQNYIECLDRLSNPEEKFHALTQLLYELKKVGVSLRLRDVNQFADQVITYIRENALALAKFDRGEEAGSRFSVLSRLLKGAEDAFKDSPYYAVLDPKLDRLAEDIQATEAEAKIIHAVKTFGQDPIEFLYRHDSANVKKTGEVLGILDLIVTTMKWRSMEENNRVRDYLFSRPLTALAEAELRDILASDILNLGGDVIDESFPDWFTDTEYEEERAERLLRDKIVSLRDEFRLLQPNGKLIAGSFLLVVPSRDGRIIDAPWFQRSAIKDFFVAEGDGSANSPYLILAEELLNVIEPHARALLITQAELQNQAIIVNGSDRDLQAERIASLFMSLGAYGVKIAQLLARIPNIDPILRDRLRRLEDHAETPAYFVLYQLLHPHLMADEERDLVRIFGVRAGSIKVTLFVEFRSPNGEFYKKAFSIRRQHVRRLIDRMHERVRKALQRTYERTNLDSFKPFLSLPDDARAMLEDELNFASEFTRLGEAGREYARVRTSAESTVGVIQAERISRKSEEEQAIVLPYLESRRLDELPDDAQGLEFEKIARLEVRLFLKNIKRPNYLVRLDTDRHLGNILVVDDEDARRSVHIDMGQWVGIPVSHRDFFARTLVALIADYTQENSFENLRSVLAESFQVEDIASSWWTGLEKDLQGLRENADTDFMGTVLTSVMHIREAIKGSDPKLGRSLFRLSKLFETLMGVANRLSQSERFYQVLMEEFASAAKVDLATLMANPLVHSRNFFEKASHLDSRLLQCAASLAN